MVVLRAKIGFGQWYTSMIGSTLQAAAIGELPDCLSTLRGHQESTTHANGQLEGRWRLE